MEYLDTLKALQSNAWKNVSILHYNCFCIETYRIHQGHYNMNRNMVTLGTVFDNKGARYSVTLTNYNCFHIWSYPDRLLSNMKSNWFSTFYLWSKRMRETEELTKKTNALCSTETILIIYACNSNSLIIAVAW